MLALPFNHLGKEEQSVRFYCKVRTLYIISDITWWIKYVTLVGVQIKGKMLWINVACVALMPCLAWTSEGSGDNYWIWFGNFFDSMTKGKKGMTVWASQAPLLTSPGCVICKYNIGYTYGNAISSKRRCRS